MSYDSYHKRKIGTHVLKPETQMMGYGYDPSLSEGALKPPIFLTSTFVFKTAQDGKDFFDFTSGRREPPPRKRSDRIQSCPATTTPPPSSDAVPAACGKEGGPDPTAQHRARHWPWRQERRSWQRPLA